MRAYLVGYFTIKHLWFIIKDVYHLPNLNMNKDYRKKITQVIVVAALYIEVYGLRLSFLTHSGNTLIITCSMRRTNFNYVK